MRLLVVCPYFYPRAGGLENYAYNISKRLEQKYDVNPVVVCSHWDNQPLLEECVDGIRVYRLPYGFKVSSTPVNLLWKRTLRAIIEKEKPDFVNGHIPVPYIADVAARIAKQREIPFILTYHNDLTGSNPLVEVLSRCYYKFMGDTTLEIAQTLIITSQHYGMTSSHLRKYLPKQKVVPPGVDTDRYQARSSKILQERYNIQNEKTVLFVGQLNKESMHKGLHYLIKAILDVNKKMPVRLIVAGRGNYLTQYREYAREEKIDHRVVFTGYVPEEELIELYSACDLVVLPSYTRAEGFGMVLLEAQACGTPVIGSNVGGISCAIKDGETGLLVPPKDTQRLSRAITDLLEDDALMRKMGLEGMKRVRDEFTWEKSTQTYYSILSEVADKIGRRPAL